MIYQPEFRIPYQHIGIVGSAVNIGEKTIQPYDLRSQPDIYRCYNRIETDGAGKIMQTEIQSDACL